MSHYLPAKLIIPITSPLICALPECKVPVPRLPAPPPFSLLKATSAMLNPTERDVRIFFCSEEHRDKYWQSEQGWLDRRVAMPSVRPSGWQDGVASAALAPNCGLVIIGDVVTDVDDKERALTGPAAFNRMTDGNGRGFDPSMMMSPAHGGGHRYAGWMHPSPMGMSNGMMPLTSQPPTPVQYPAHMSSVVHPQVRVPWTLPFFPRPGC